LFKKNLKDKKEKTLLKSIIMLKVTVLKMEDLRESLIFKKLLKITTLSQFIKPLIK
jgi:hypothetical protein